MDLIVELDYLMSSSHLKQGYLAPHRMLGIHSTKDVVTSLSYSFWITDLWSLMTRSMTSQIQIYDPIRTLATSTSSYPYADSFQIQEISRQA